MQGMRWSPESLAEACGGVLVRRSDRPIAGAFIDSREPRPGALFVPIVAARDGHDFIPHAVAGGASAVLATPGRSLPDGDYIVASEAEATELTLEGTVVRTRTGIASGSIRMGRSRAPKWPPISARTEVRSDSAHDHSSMR